jgi:hypothetical protein
MYYGAEALVKTSFKNKFQIAVTCSNHAASYLTQLLNKKIKNKKMTTRILGLVALTLVMVTTTFAKNIEDNVSRKALSTFTQKFADAKDVSWFKAENYYKATFTMNDQVYTAFITGNGEWLGVSRNLVSTQLPINLQSDLKKEYGQYWITELFEFATEDQTIYYAIVENGDNKISLKTSGGYEWSVFKKTKKN